MNEEWKSVVGWAMRALAREFEVDRTTIRSIIRGENWAHISFPSPPEKP